MTESLSVTRDSEFDLSGLKQGDSRAFAQLVTAYHNQLLVVARSIIGPSLAEEVVQEAWVSAYKAMAKFEGRSSLKTWLYTIVSNGAKTRLRKESRQVRFSDDEQKSAFLEGRFSDDGHWSSPPSQWELASPDRLLQEDELKACIEQTLLLLPPQQKAVFQLRELDQESLESICNILDVSSSNVRVLLHRARVKLMQVIDGYQQTGQCEPV